MASLSCQNGQQCPNDRWEIAGNRWIVRDVQDRSVQSKPPWVDLQAGSTAYQTDSADGNVDSTADCHYAACPKYTLLPVFCPCIPRHLPLRLERLLYPATIEQVWMYYRLGTVGRCCIGAGRCFVYSLFFVKWRHGRHLKKCDVKRKIWLAHI